MQGNFSTPIPAGFSIRSSIIPQAGSIDTDLGFPINNGDVIHLFDRDQQKYAQYAYEQGGWISGVPVVGLGESFWVGKKKAENWVRKYPED